MFLDGYKTKIIIVATLLYAISGLILGYLDANTAGAMIMFALTSGGIYHKIERGD